MNKIKEKGELVLYVDNTGRVRIGRVIEVEDSFFKPAENTASWIRFTVVHSDGSTAKLLRTNTTFLVTKETIKSLVEQTELLTKE